VHGDHLRFSKFIDNEDDASWKGKNRARFRFRSGSKLEIILWSSEISAQYKIYTGFIEKGQEMGILNCKEVVFNRRFFYAAT